MIKEWRSIMGYDYDISNFGEVRSPRGERSPVFKNGYLSVQLWKKGVCKTKYIHRLIAENFIEPFHGETVNHKNHDRTDNRIENLEWTTNRKNTAHGKGRYRKLPTNVYRTQNSKFQVQMMINGKVKSFGTFALLKDATQIAQEARRNL